MNQAIAFAANIDKQVSRFIGAIPVLIPIFQRLDVVSIINRYCPNQADVDSGTVALILSLNRLIAPKPMYKVSDWMSETVLEETLAISSEKLHDRRIGDMLDEIHPHLSSIYQEIVLKAIQSFGIPTDFVHYDVTSIYFEGVYSDADKIEYGYSRDQKPECKQVNLGLNVTGENAIPLAYSVICGSTSDKTTPLENMSALQQLFSEITTEEDGIIIVSDQAMLNPDVILTYHQQDIGYLGPLPNHKVYDSVLMSVTTSQLLKHPLSYRPQNQKADDHQAIYYGILSDVTISSTKSKRSVDAQALILYSRNKAKLDREKRQTLLNRYTTRLFDIQRHLNKRKYKKATYTQQQIDKAQRKYKTVKDFVKVQLMGIDGNLTLSFDIDIKLITQAAQRDGRYLIVTNRHLSEEEMLLRFKQQDKIEKQNRTLKGPIQIRPMFLHKQNRIEALIFICMLALLVFSILELWVKREGIQMTAKSLMEKFSPLTVVYTFFLDGSCFKKVEPLTELQKQIIQALNLPPPEIYLQYIRIQ